MTTKTKAQIESEISSLFADNTTGLITPLDLRSVTTDICDSILPTAPVVSGNALSFNGTTGLYQDSGVALTGVSGKTLTFNNSLTLAGTDGTTMTFPATTDTVVGLAATQTLTNKTLANPALATTAPTANGYLGFNSGTALNWGDGSTNHTAVSLDQTQTLTNKTLTAPNIGAATGTSIALGTAGSVVGSASFANATSGTITLQPVTGALGSVTASLPANTGTIAELNFAQTWSAAQTFTNSDILLLGSSTGATTFASANAGATNYTATFPANTGTIAELNLAQTWSANQTNSSSFLVSGASAGVGYTTGAGGAVTQITSRTTGVTLNTITGAITLFAGAPTVGTWVSFTVTNSAVAATDVPHVAVKSGTDTYIAHVTAVAAGSFQISFTSISGTTSDSPVINFAIIKGSAN